MPNYDIISQCSWFGSRGLFEDLRDDSLGSVIQMYAAEVTCVVGMIRQLSEKSDSMHMEKTR